MFEMEIFAANLFDRLCVERPSVPTDHAQLGVSADWVADPEADNKLSSACNLLLHVERLVHRNWDALLARRSRLMKSKLEKPNKYQSWNHIALCIPCIFNQHYFESFLMASSIKSTIGALYNVLRTYGTATLGRQFSRTLSVRTACASAISSGRVHWRSKVITARFTITTHWFPSSRRPLSIDIDHHCSWAFRLHRRR